MKNPQKGIVFGIMCMLMLAGMVSLAFKTLNVKASGTIYIKADGSIEPSTAPIQRFGDTFIFTDNIYDSIVVEKNNIIILGSGFKVQGKEGG
jgi:hypothetical protein